MKQDLVYIGTSHSIIEKIINHPFFNLQQIICESKRIKDIHIKTSEQFGIPLVPFESKPHFKELIESFNSNKIVFLIYQLDMIVQADLTTKYRFFNLHAGDVKTNRGAHPIIRSVLNGDQKTELTFHEINEKIDQGNIVAKYPIKLSELDTPLTIKTRMEEGISYLLNQLVFFIKGEISGTEAEGGKYYKPISEKDFTIDIHSDSKENIERKIRSQVQYNGAIFYYKKEKYFIKELFDWNRSENIQVKVDVREMYIQINGKAGNFKFKFNKA